MSAGRKTTSMNNSSKMYMFANSETAKKKLIITDQNSQEESIENRRLLGAAEYILTLPEVKAVDLLGEFVDAQLDAQEFWSALKEKDHQAVVDAIDHYLQDNHDLLQRLKKNVLAYFKATNPNGDIRLLTLETMSDHQTIILTYQSRIVFRQLLAIESEIYRGERQRPVISSTATITAQFTQTAHIEESKVVAITPFPDSPPIENSPAPVTSDLPRQPLTHAIASAHPEEKEPTEDSPPLEEEKNQAPLFECPPGVPVHSEYFSKPKPQPNESKKPQTDDSYFSYGLATFSSLYRKTTFLVNQAGESVANLVVGQRPK